MVAKVARVRFASLKKSSFFFCPEKKWGKTKRVFFGLPLQLWPPTCDRHWHYVSLKL